MNHSGLLLNTRLMRYQLYESMYRLPPLRGVKCIGPPYGVGGFSPADRNGEYVVLVKGVPTGIDFVYAKAREPESCERDR